MNPKLEQTLAKIEDLANELNQENDDQSKQVALALMVLASASWIDQETEFNHLIQPLKLKIMMAAKQHNII